MKWFFVTTLLLSSSLVLAKTVEKTGPIKKASSVKPTKSPKSILEEFSGLSDDDTKFIKELDKQFKIHGDKIKIKVQKENGTSSKNSKRTIDGALGYGYQQPTSEGFFFSPPRFMIYPYSQEDIPPAKFHTEQQQFIPSRSGFSPAPPFKRPIGGSPLHTSVRTAVSIQPSQGYEIHEEGGHGVGLSGGYHGQQQLSDFQGHGHGQEQIPVIVLRIPGPQKYAAHLQQLLQRYLEIRAAQYIQEIQQQEAHGHGVAHEEHVQQPYAGPKYLPNVSQQSTAVTYVTPIPDHGPTQGFSTPATHGYSTPAPQHFGGSDSVSEVYPSQAVYEDHQIETIPAHIPQQQHHVPVHYQQEEEQLDDEVYQQPASHGQHQQYEQAQQEELYHQQAQQHQQHIEQQYEEPEIPISENYPSNRHTQVIFNHQQRPQSVTPASRPNTQVVYQQKQPHPDQIRQFQHGPEPHVIHQQQHHTRIAIPASGSQHQPQFEYYQQEEHAAPATQYQQVVITPKPRVPFNFHAHPGGPSTLQQLGRNSKRNAPYSEEQFKKFNKIINRLKKQSNHQPPARIVRRILEH